MNEFYIDVSSATACFTKLIKRLCESNSYVFRPNNSKYYHINKQNKTCIGVKKKTKNIETINESVSYLKLRKYFVFIQ